MARCKVIHDVEKKAEWSFKEKEKQKKQLGLIKILSHFVMCTWTGKSTA